MGEVTTGFRVLRGTHLGTLWLTHLSGHQRARKAICEAIHATRMAAKKLTFHYLSEQDIVKTGLTLSESIELCTAAFKEHGEKLVENPPKVAVHPLPDAFLHAMPGRS